MHDALRHYCYHAPVQAVKSVCQSLGLTKRSTKWPSARRAWLKLHPTCAACGSSYCVQVHHKLPFHEFPNLELDPRNFITLCECHPGNDHLTLGHLGDWKKYNPAVESDASFALVRSKKVA